MSVPRRTASFGEERASAILPTPAAAATMAAAVTPSPSPGGRRGAAGSPARPAAPSGARGSPRLLPLWPPLAGGCRVAHEPVEHWNLPPPQVAEAGYLHLGCRLSAWPAFRKRPESASRPLRPHRQQSLWLPSTHRKRSRAGRHHLPGHKLWPHLARQPLAPFPRRLRPQRPQAHAAVRGKQPPQQLPERPAGARLRQLPGLLRSPRFARQSSRP
mmetsp:Transcript_49893/g.142740  ORF Transcript_49893/g.142740 Transcript_49893/m.142740 type:complete len:215 (-) Transcript_49893:492-1136(-)